jgi:phage baseplate assembly protein W
MSTYDLATIIKDDTDIGVFALTAPYRSGAYITGIQKLVQRFITELFTDVGSVRIDPSFGSNLMREIRGANVQAVTDIHGGLVSAIHHVRQNMQQRVIGNEPRDEILADVNIVRLEPQLDKVIVVLKIVAASGNSRVTRLPIDFIDIYHSRN